MDRLDARMALMSVSKAQEQDRRTHVDSDETEESESEAESDEVFHARTPHRHIIKQ
jgi:hypothetical protein